MDRQQQPELVEVYVTVVGGDRHPDSGDWRRFALAIAILAVAAALTAIVLMPWSGIAERQAPVRPPIPATRQPTGPPILDADGDLDGSRATLRLHFDADDAGDLGGPKPGR